jgi:hypothetical protein
MLRTVPVRVCLGRIELAAWDGLRFDCRRVLIVSIGNSDTSTVRPAMAPAFKTSSAQYMTSFIGKLTRSDCVHGDDTYE